MAGSYTPTGPWTNGGAPGISASFLNGLEAWIELIDNTTGVTVTGSSGTATLYQFLQGMVKAGIVYWSGYKNSSNQNLILPVALTSTCQFWIAETQSGTVTFLSSGSGVTCSVQDTVSSTGGTENAATNIGPWTNGQTRGGFDTIQLRFPSTTAAGGNMFFVGI